MSSTTRVHLPIRLATAMTRGKAGISAGYAIAVIALLTPAGCEELLGGKSASAIASSVNLKVNQPKNKIHNVGSNQKCDLSKITNSRKTTKYGIFGDDTFDTAVCGYLTIKEELVFDKKETITYFRVLKFKDEGFKESVRKGVLAKNTVNSLTNGAYELGLGCLVKQRIVNEVDYQQSEPYMDQVTQERIAKSSLARPVSLIFSYGRHEGQDCVCCNLAYKVRVYE